MKHAGRRQRTRERHHTEPEPGSPTLIRMSRGSRLRLPAAKHDRMSPPEPRGRPTTHGVVRGADRARWRAAVELGRGTSRREPQLLGRHRERSPVARRDAGVGRVAAGDGHVRLLVRTRRPQGTQHRPEPAGLRDGRRHGRVRVGRRCRHSPGRRRGTLGSGHRPTPTSTRRPTSERRCARSCSVTPCSRSGR